MSVSTKPFMKLKNLALQTVTEGHCSRPPSFKTMASRFLAWIAADNALLPLTYCVQIMACGLLRIDQPGRISTGCC